MQFILYRSCIIKENDNVKDLAKFWYLEETVLKFPFSSRTAQQDDSLQRKRSFSDVTLNRSSSRAVCTILFVSFSFVTVVTKSIKCLFYSFCTFLKCSHLISNLASFILAFDAKSIMLRGYIMRGKKT